MIWNPWVHIRAAGAVLFLIAAFTGHGILQLYGGMVVLIGMLGGLNRIERIVAELVKPVEEEKED